MSFLSITRKSTGLPVAASQCHVDVQDGVEMLVVQRADSLVTIPLIDILSISLITEDAVSQESPLPSLHEKQGETFDIADDVIV